MVLIRDFKRLKITRTFEPANRLAWLLHGQIRENRTDGPTSPAMGESAWENRWSGRASQLMSACIITIFVVADLTPPGLRVVSGEDGERKVR